MCLEKPDENFPASMQDDNQFVGVELSCLSRTVLSSKSPSCTRKFGFLKLEV